MIKIGRPKFDNLQAPPRLQAILMSPHALVCIIPDASPFREMSLALRLSHDLLLYHRLDVRIILESDALRVMGTNGFPSGNIVYIGHPSTTFVRTNLDKKETSFEMRNSSLALSGHILDDSSIGNVPLAPVWSTLCVDHIAQLLCSYTPIPKTAKGRGLS